MSVLTKTRHTEKQHRKGPYLKFENIPWRELFKKDIKKRGEPAIYLRGSRLRDGLTQAQLAKKLGKGVSQHHISEMENGKRKITLEMAKRLGSVFKTDFRLFL